MNIKIDEYDQVYDSRCKCGKTHYLVTQKDDRPEYYTSVNLICDCKEFVYFTLPVN